MASVASRVRPLPRLESLTGSAIGVGGILLLLFAVSLLVRTRALGGSLWMDEGLSIGIASQGFFEIPGILKQDGSPPLYYLLLNVWMSAFGNGPGETQGLSVAISLLSIPVALWGGWSLFGRRAGLMAAALAAVNPFITTYAQETRMYSLMVVLSLATTVAFLHVFVYRRRGYLPVFAVLLALMLYTHNWGLFVTFGALAGVVYCWRASDDRKALLRDAALGFGFAGLLYLPWLPTLAYQIGHTGAPWLNHPRFGAPVQLSKSLLGGGTATVALVLAAGSGLATIVVKRVNERERQAILAVAILGLATLVAAWVVSQVSPAWTTRYLGVALGPIFLLASLGLARSGNLGLVALIIVVGIWAVPKSDALSNKSNVSDLATAVETELRPGDLVISMQPEQTPLISYHLQEGLRYATPIGPVERAAVMDWRDSLDKLESATPQKNLEPLLANLPRSRRVMLVHPVTSRLTDWDAPWTSLIRRRSAQWGLALEQDRRFRRVSAVPSFYRRAGRIGIRGVIYEKS